MAFVKKESTEEKKAAPATKEDGFDVPLLPLVLIGGVVLCAFALLSKKKAPVPVSAPAQAVKKIPDYFLQ